MKITIDMNKFNEEDVRKSLGVGGYTYECDIVNRECETKLTIETKEFSEYFFMLTVVKHLVFNNINFQLINDIDHVSLTDELSNLTDADRCEYLGIENITY